MKALRILLITLLAVLLIGVIGMIVWATASAQDATEPALEILNQNGVEREDGLLVFRPNSPTNTGLIYYPGGLVEPEAYAATAQGIADEGYLVVVPKMPLNLAFTGINRADAIQEQFPEIDSWIIGGHSLGGAMAAQYAKNNVDDLDGLIMYASYPANNEDFVDFPIAILSISASNDPGTPNQAAFYETVSDSATQVIIEGGNHRQYADYAYQPRDGMATITAAQQQAEIVKATVEFIESLE
ncbi:MAG: alpha/beta hydrolase [Anaerolineae bacterium]|nr:alpha/beta hydrolase [Anaerolineae bacterium]